MVHWYEACTLTTGVTVTYYHIASQIRHHFHIMRARDHSKCTKTLDTDKFTSSKVSYQPSDENYGPVQVRKDVHGYR